MTADQDKTTYWLKTAAAVFAAWSLMLPITASMVQRSVDRIIAQQDNFQARFESYVLATERRLTLVEDRQSRVLQWIDKQEKNSSGAP